LTKWLWLLLLFCRCSCSIFKNLPKIADCEASSKVNKIARNQKCRFLDSELTVSQGQTDTFLQEVVAILLDYIRASNDRKSLVVDFHHPTELKQLLGHLLPVGQDRVGLDEILRDCRETLKYCVRTGQDVYSLLILINSTNTWRKYNQIKCLFNVQTIKEYRVRH